ncbi:MAG: hypothetical protein ACR2JJ_03225 [Sphingomicrobium sp.]
MSKTDDENDKASDERRAKLRKAGVAVGVGSAAIVAALLYASKVKKTPKDKSADAVRAQQGDGGTD